MLVKREEGVIYGDVVEKNVNENMSSCGVALLSSLDGHPSCKSV